MGQWMDGFLEKMAVNNRENLEGGGQDRIALQHDDLPTLQTARYGDSRERAPGSGAQRGKKLDAADVG